MAALTLNTIRLYTLALGVALALAPPALAGDVSVKLDAGTGFSVKDNTGATERLRVDEATGNISRNGALFVHTTGLNSLFVGPLAGNTSTAISGRNSGVGYRALHANTTGAGNSAFGAYALRSNTTGNYNSAVGTGALRSNTTGYYNAAVGSFALGSNTSGHHNSAVGFFALYANTTGNRNSAVGYRALQPNTTGNRNSAVGYSALRLNTAGNGNSAFGDRALYSNTTGSSNSAFGSSALPANTTGYSNSVVGVNALFYNTTGNGNTAIGYRALNANTTGARNVAVGEFAGFAQTTGNDNIYLAAGAVAGESGQIRIGQVGTHSATFIAGIRGKTTGVANAIPVLIDSAGQLGTVNSSRSVKKEIRDMGDSTDRLLDLRPVTFRYKQEQTLPNGAEAPPEYGLIAEEVAEVFPDLVVYDEKGQPFTVKYHELAPMLLNEMKKEQHAIQAQQQAIEAEKREHQQEIAALTTRLAQLETRVSDARGEAQR